MTDETAEPLPPTTVAANSEWVSIEQAALILNCSTRTVHRHIAQNRLQSRTTEEGRREVLVAVPEKTPAPATPNESPNTSENFNAMIEKTDRQQQILISVYQNQLQQVSTERNQARQTVRKMGLLAGTAIALMLLLILITVAIVSRLLTRAEAQATHLSSKVEEIDRERTNLQKELLVVQEKSGRLSGKIDELQSQLSASQLAQQAARAAETLALKAKAEALAVAQAAEAKLAEAKLAAEKAASLTTQPATPY